MSLRLRLYVLAFVLVNLAFLMMVIRLARREGELA
jgi:hypothetical protein